MQVQASQKVKQLEKEGFHKVSCFPSNHKKHNFPCGEIVTTNARLSLMADSWNSGNNKRIFVGQGANILSLTKEYCQNNGLYGKDDDKVRGLWVKGEFDYGYPLEGESE